MDFFSFAKKCHDLLIYRPPVLPRAQRKGVPSKSYYVVQCGLTEISEGFINNVWSFVAMRRINLQASRSIRRISSEGPHGVQGRPAKFGLVLTKHGTMRYRCRRRRCTR